ISFKCFCDYILPYRVSVEPVQSWQATYASRFIKFKETINSAGIQKAFSLLNANFQTWFTDTYDVEIRKEPLPRLGAMQLLSRKKGPCEDIADLTAFIFRSQGLPAALDITPFWGTS